MIQLTRRRLLALNESIESTVHLHHADVTRASFPRTDYDLVVTHFFFDVFSAKELETLIGHVADSLARTVFGWCPNSMSQKPERRVFPRVFG